MILADILFKQGFGTRYDCRSIATSGAVSIDGRELTDPDEDFDLEGLVLTWRGMQWPVSDNVLIAMNKPTGYECSLKPSAHPFRHESSSRSTSYTRRTAGWTS